MRCKWIFKKKSRSSSDKVIKYESCLVEKGYNKTEGVDYNEFFSLVIRHTSIRVLLALVATLDMELEQLNVKADFVHGRLEEDILLQQSECFKMQGKIHYVCRLKSSLYGLKQSPRQWWNRFNEFIVSHGYNRSLYDSCVYNT